tara:strand:+ start:105 stop:239 length:135 start_codon:yes stop_codon:yes gene_type:complete
MNLNKLVEENPNDQELGSKVREFYWKNKDQSYTIDNQFWTTTIV